MLLKTATAAQRLQMISNWLPILIASVKKDLKNNHLPQNPQFYKTYFKNKTINKISVEELVDVYSNAILKGDEDISQFVINAWLLDHGMEYLFFEQELKTITSDFTELELIEPAKSNEIIERSIQRFGAPNTFLFSILNSVVFPEDILNALNKRAEAEAASKALAHAEAQKEQQDIRNQEQFQAAISRLTDKFEKKLEGMQKKYNADTTALKKQISMLQKKLNGNGASA